MRNLYKTLIAAALAMPAVSYAAPFSSQQLATTSLTNGYVLQTNGSNNKWVSTSSLNISGGGGTPASPSGSIQFNNAGSFGGSANGTLDSLGNAYLAGSLKVGTTSSPAIIGASLGQASPDTTGAPGLIVNGQDGGDYSSSNPGNGGPIVLKSGKGGGPNMGGIGSGNGGEMDISAGNGGDGDAGDAGGNGGNLVLSSGSAGADNGSGPGQQGQTDIIGGGAGGISEFSLVSQNGDNGSLVSNLSSDFVDMSFLGYNSGTPDTTNMNNIRFSTAGAGLPSTANPSSFLYLTPNIQGAPWAEFGIKQTIWQPWVWVHPKGLSGCNSCLTGSAFLQVDQFGTTTPPLIVGTTTSPNIYAAPFSPFVGFGTTTPSTEVTASGTTTSSTGFRDLSRKNACAAFDNIGDIIASTTACGGSGGGGGVSGGTNNMLAAWTSATTLTATSVPQVASINATSSSATSVFAGALTAATSTAAMLDKGGAVYNVKAYGAVGDNSHDDTSAINSTIAAMPSAGGVLYFPTGAFKTSSTIVISKPMTIMGTGISSIRATTTLSSNSQSSIVMSTTTGTAFNVTSTGAVTFKDLSIINTTASNPTSGSGILVTGTDLWQRTDYDSIMVYGFYNDVDSEGGAYWTMENAFIAAPVNYGLYVQNTVNTDSGDWNVSNTTFSPYVRNAQAAVYIQSSGGGKFVNVKVNCADVGCPANFKYGIEGHLSSTGVSSNLAIANSSFENYGVSNVGNAIDLVNYNNVTITGNEFGQFGNSGGYPINLATTSYGTITGNTFVGTANYAVNTTGVNLMTYAGNTRQGSVAGDVNGSPTNSYIYGSDGFNNIVLQRNGGNVIDYGNLSVDSTNLSNGLTVGANALVTQFRTDSTPVLETDQQAGFNGSNYAFKVSGYSLLDGLRISGNDSGNMIYLSGSSNPLSITSDTANETDFNQWNGSSDLKYLTVKNGTTLYGSSTLDFLKGCNQVATNSAGQEACVSSIGGVATSTGSLRNQTGTVPSVNALTPTASSTYQVSVSATVDAVSADTLTITCTYTNTNGAATTATIGTGLTTAVSLNAGPLIITPMRNTAVKVVATVTGVGSMTYDIDASILPVGTQTL